MWNSLNHDFLKEKLSAFTNYYTAALTEDTPIDNLWNVLHYNLLDIIDKYIPSKAIKNNSKQPWISRNIIQLRRRKQRCYNRARSSNTTLDWNRYKDIKRTMQRETRRAFNHYMYKTIHTPYENGKRKRFYKYIKSLKSDHTGIPPLQKDGKSFTASHAKAKILNNYFSTVFTPDINDEDLPTTEDSPFPSIF